MATGVLLLERGLTPAGLNDFFASEAELTSLVDTLASGIDSNVLIETIKAARKADVLALRPFFAEGADIGTLGKLAPGSLTHTPLPNRP